MAHGGYGKHRVAGRKPDGNNRRSKALAVDKKAGKTKTKPKTVSLKNQIRSIERMLRKDLPPEVREAQEKKLEDFRKQQVHISCEAVKRKALLRGKKIRFFERRKIERSIRRLEKQLRASSDPAQQAEISEQLSKLKEDLEYVKFFPKTEVYVSLFIGDDDPDIVDSRERLRKEIKANLIAAAANGKDLEETGSEDDGLLDLSEDDFFLGGSSSDEADADDEWTDKSMREQASCASGKAASSMSSDERNQKHISDCALMPPPQPSNRSHTSSSNVNPRFGGSINKKAALHRAVMSTSSNTSNSMSQSSFRNRGSLNSHAGQSSNLSSSSDARKARRKRRPKKKKPQA